MHYYVVCSMLLSKSIASIFSKGKNIVFLGNLFVRKFDFNFIIVFFK